MPHAPGAGTRCGDGGLRELPHAAERGTLVIRPPDGLSGHGGAGYQHRGAGVLPGTIASLRACPGTEGRIACPGSGIWPSPATTSTANTAFVPDTSKCSLIIYICHLLRNR